VRSSFLLLTPHLSAELRKLHVCVLQLHGEMHIDTQHADSILDLGFRRSTRVRKHAAARL